MENAYHAGSRVLSVLLFGVGVTLVASTLLRGGGPLALGVIVGVAFAALGLLRLRLAGGLGGRRAE